MLTALRVVAGVIAALVFLLGRGARINGLQIDSAPDFWIGTILQIFAASLALAVFVLLHRTRLSGPKASQRFASRTLVGYTFLALGGVLLLSTASLFWVGAGNPGPVGRVAREVLVLPDIALKTIVALLAVAAGASAVGHNPAAATLVRAAAVPLVLVWPLGSLAAAWGAWATLSSEWRLGHRAAPSA